MDGWMDAGQNRQKWALAPQVFEIRIFGKKQALFWPIWATEKICQNFRPTKFSMRKPRNGRFSFVNFIASVFFLDFRTQVVVFGGQKSKNFDFFFWVPNGFLGGLGVVWGLYKWILDISG